MTLSNFRPHIKGPTPLTEKDLPALCRRGELAKVLSWLKQHGCDPADHRELIGIGCKVLVRNHRVGELLSLLYKHHFPCDVEVIELLRIMLALGDIPGFLKQASRFQVFVGLESEIDHAISWLETKKQVGSADAYRKQFAALRSGLVFDPAQSRSKKH